MGVERLSHTQVLKFLRDEEVCDISLYDEERIDSLRLTPEYVEYNDNGMCLVLLSDDKWNWYKCTGSNMFYVLQSR